MCTYNIYIEGKLRATAGWTEGVKEVDCSSTSAVQALDARIVTCICLPSNYTVKSVKLNVYSL